MVKVNIAQAQSDLKSLIEAAISGETVLIVTDEQHTVQIVPTIEALGKRVFGSGAGVIIMHDDFDDPLEDFIEYME